MNYAELLKSYIKESKMTLDEISTKVGERGLTLSREHLSRLQNGKTAPAHEEMNRVLAEVTGGDSEALLLAGYIEKAPDEIKSILAEATNTGGLFSLFAHLIMYLEEYRSTGVTDEELLHNIEIINDVFAQDFKYRLATSSLKDFPEYSTVLIARLKQHFIPQNDTISFHGAKLDLTDYVTKDGNPIFKESPYPEMVASGSAAHLEKMKTDKPVNFVKFPEYDDNIEIQQKLDFFMSLEADLGLDLTDPEVQKKLKRAAKIIFSTED